MTVRTFIQEGKGYGTTATTIRAKIDGSVVFEGPVNTVDEPIPDIPNDATVIDSVMFSWESTVDFSGNFLLEIEVLSGNALIVTDTFADYVDPQNSEKFGNFYLSEDIGDPFIDVAINGVSVVRDRDLDPEKLLNGQWWYVVNSGEVLTATVAVQPGVLPPSPPETP